MSRRSRVHHVDGCNKSKVKSMEYCPKDYKYKAVFRPSPLSKYIVEDLSLVTCKHCLAKLKRLAKQKVS